MEKATGATPADVERCNKALEEALVLAEKMTPLTPENKWVLDGTKEGVTVHSTYDASGLAMSRGEGDIDVPMEDLCEYLFDEKYLGDYDSSMEVNERLATIDDRTRVVWELTKKITFISQRDFLYCCRWQKKDDKIVIVARSIDWPSKPVGSGHVRASLRLVTWILSPVAGKPNSTHTIHIVSVDLAGSIPSAIVTRETLKQGYVTIKIRETAGAYLKKRGPRKVEEKKVEEKPVETKKAEEKPAETKKEECCAEKKTETKKEECCAEKKECCAEEKKAEDKECCDKGKECADKKECCEEKGECAEKKAAEEPKKEAEEPKKEAEEPKKDAEEPKQE